MKFYRLYILIFRCLWCGCLTLIDASAGYIFKTQKWSQTKALSLISFINRLTNFRIKFIIFVILSLEISLFANSCSIWLVTDAHFLIQWARAFFFQDLDGRDLSRCSIKRPREKQAVVRLYVLHAWLLVDESAFLQRLWFRQWMLLHHRSDICLLACLLAVIEEYIVVALVAEAFLQQGALPSFYLDFFAILIHFIWSRFFIY